MSDCLFCKMAGKQIPATFIYEDDDMFVVNDINPQAPLHALIIPKAHIPTLNDLEPAHDALAGEMVRRAAAIAQDRGYAGRGFRTLIAPDGGRLRSVVPN